MKKEDIKIDNDLIEDFRNYVKPFTAKLKLY